MIKVKQYKACNKYLVRGGLHNISITVLPCEGHSVEGQSPTSTHHNTVVILVRETLGSKVRTP